MAELADVWEKRLLALSIMYGMAVSAAHTDSALEDLGETYNDLAAVIVEARRDSCKCCINHSEE
jgi:hypothetical protein